MGNAGWFDGDENESLELVLSGRTSATVHGVNLDVHIRLYYSKDIAHITSTCTVVYVNLAEVIE